ncbi:immunoglobulin-like domain-containing protein [Zhouia amylolytica]|nr:immunoglobulin-like domain-containing protein [Zhouia amylolytica]
MKQIITLITVGIIALSCSEKSPIKSNITYYPTFEVIDGPYIITELGSGFTDPGVIANEGENEIPVSVTGSVDPNTEGFYILEYSATNSDGFSATTTRNVIVTSSIDDVLNTDLSGTYWRSNNPDRAAEVTKVADGFYNITDAFPPNGIAVVFGQVNGTTLVIPEQSSVFGSVIADEYTDPQTSAFIIDDATIGWNMRVGGFGVFGIEFNKQ